MRAFTPKPGQFVTRQAPCTREDVIQLIKTRRRELEAAIQSSTESTPEVAAELEQITAIDERISSGEIDNELLDKLAATMTKSVRASPVGCPACGSTNYSGSLSSGMSCSCGYTQDR